ncbi:MAG: family 4 glycosyl hydrolase [Anaerolineae bacterium]
MVKIALIGAGSGAFALALLRDLCLSVTLRGSTVALIDINPERLRASTAVCRRYTAEVGGDLRLEPTLERRTALQGADYVVNTALAAGHQRLRAGWEIAQRHGFNWGGSFHVMYDEAFWINYYQFRLFEELAEDALRECPQAVHLQVANPVISGVTYIGRKYPELKWIGLCHGYAHVYQVTDFLGLERAQVAFEAPGVNHFIWLTRLTCRGEDVFPLLDRWIAEHGAEYWASGKQWPISRKSADLYRRYGAFPIGDTASWSGACWPYEYHSSDAVQAAWQQEPVRGWDRYFEGVSANAADFQRLAADPTLRVTDKYPPVRSGEAMIPIIEALAGGQPGTFIANILNTGAYIPGLPRDFQVEVPVRCEKGVYAGQPAAGLPPELAAHILQARVAPINIELEAYRRGSRELLRQLVLLDPWARSAEQVDAFMDEIFAMEGHEEMRHWYM